MKKRYSILVLAFFLMALVSCEKTKEAKQVSTTGEEKEGIVGTWLLVYGETRTGDSIEIKDLSNTEFIKILNKDHFAFFNQVKDTAVGFYGGGGSYTLDGKNYVEQLDYIGLKELRGEVFTFTLEVKGDTLIQSGIEDVPEANIKRHIVEKYIRLK